MQTWNKVKVIREILDRNDKGLSLASRAVVASNTPLMGAARKYFKGWAQAVEAAGLDYDNIKSKNQSRIFWDKGRIVNAILVLKAKQSSLGLKDIKKSEHKLLKAAVKWFGGWSKAVEAAGLDYEEIKLSSRCYKWSREMVLQKILKRYKANQSLSSSNKEIDLQRLVNAAIRHFGSWKNAIEKSGVNYDQLIASRVPVKKWNEAKVIKTILYRKSKDLPLNYSYVQRRVAKLHDAGRRYFGTWKKAIEAAGLDYKDVRSKRRITKWGRRNVIRAIRLRSNSNLPLNSMSVQKDILSLHGAARKYFGTWKKAVEAAGFSYTVVRLRKPVRQWTREEIVQKIKLRKRAGLALNGPTVLREDQGLYKAAMRYFGRYGWKNALIAAGINPTDVSGNRIWSKRGILARIRKLHRQGQPLYGNALKKAGELSLVNAGTNYFGSWRKTIEAAGLKWTKVRGVKKHKWWTKNRVIARIKYLYAKGVPLNFKFIHTYHAGLHGTAEKLFGSWSEAVYAAGFDYQKHSKVWSTKAWLRRLNSKDIDRLKEGAREKSRRM